MTTPKFLSDAEIELIKNRAINPLSTDSFEIAAMDRKNMLSHIAAQQELIENLKMELKYFGMSPDLFTECTTYQKSREGK